MTGFSTLPLQIASIVGFAFLLFGVLIMVFILSKFLLRGSIVPGFPFLASIITIFSGAQLFALGIFGEYLARMHFRTMDRPTYLVRDSTADGAIVGDPPPSVGARGLRDDVALTPEAPQARGAL